MENEKRKINYSQYKDIFGDLDDTWRSQFRKVIKWFYTLDLPERVVVSNVYKFAENEIFSLQQIVLLEDDMLIDYMDIKVGTLVVLRKAIQKLKKRERRRAVAVAADEERRVEVSPTKSTSQRNSLFQAGGHGGVQRKGKGRVAKKTNQSESGFYVLLQNSPNVPEEIKNDFFPKFYGTEEESGLLKKTSYLIMEDLTDGMTYPCIMDIKMGTRTAGEDANVVKKNFMITKDKQTTTYEYGLRLTAMRVFQKFLLT
eukprot:TRINITY_DN829_c0_g1_i2.p1 TRINITY_DN829_c0_g1~~TRINITY_DN829_c0_g1_i2.p1  ORF type:complete len:256 (-),score=69.54 TRINITY_DN829_c0_g1_i2:88-855(-)